MSEKVAIIAILVQMIANLSVRHSPPHETVRALQKNLDKLVSQVKGE